MQLSWKKSLHSPERFKNPQGKNQKEMKLEHFPFQNFVNIFFSDVIDAKLIIYYNKLN